MCVSYSLYFGKIFQVLEVSLMSVCVSYEWVSLMSGGGLLDWVLLCRGPLASLGGCLLTGGLGLGRHLLTEGLLGAQ